MAKTVSMSAKGLVVLREETAPTFEVKDDKEGVVGELTVSQGGVRWRGKYQREDVHLSWEDFDELIKNRPPKK